MKRLVIVPSFSEVALLIRKGREPLWLPRALLLQVRQHLLEFGRARAAQEFVDDGFRRRYKRTRLAHALQADFPVEVRARANRVRRYVDQIPSVQRSQRR